MREIGLVLIGFGILIAVVELFRELWNAKLIPAEEVIEKEKSLIDWMDERLGEEMAKKKEKKPVVVEDAEISEINAKVFELACKDFKKVLRKTNQKDLRRVLRTVRYLAADVEMYLDVRNEQGRGGEK